MSSALSITNTTLPTLLKHQYSPNVTKTHIEQVKAIWSEIRHEFEADKWKLHEYIFRLLNHLPKDHIAKNICVGSYSTLTFKLLIKDINKVIENYDLSHQELKSLLDAKGILKNILFLSRQIKMAERGKCDKKDILYLIHKDINSLAVGQRILLPGGYAGKEGVAYAYAHAVLYEIKRTSQTTFSFEIINTGVGSLQDPTCPTRKSSLFVSNIDFKIFEFLIVFNATRNMYDVRDYIRDELTTTGQGTYEKRGSYEEQKGQCCSFSSIYVWLERELPRELFKTLNTVMIKRSLEVLPDLIDAHPDSALVAEKHTILKNAETALKEEGTVLGITSRPLTPISPSFFSLSSTNSISSFAQSPTAPPPPPNTPQFDQPTSPIKQLKDSFWSKIAHLFNAIIQSIINSFVSLIKLIKGSV